ncbi:extracellular solute-binding protein [Oceanibacterium hippocampi]|uniref:Spermidine/putrescine-binding periplasmic protein n=1 Tax=Oceanibacterium hippocampi TaxID=745714 RepID=A0A1Y5TL25_9PROT|nr:extracellular solute-binding protein [Oceanibacterium hippocampi]SLN64550.1 Spermidine/putrescine-binding periplasmic protein precursor [Oceanibacterium hippocampi]
MVRTGIEKTLRKVALAAFAATVAGTGMSADASADDKTVYLLSWGGTIQTSFEKEGWAEKFKEATGYEMVLVPKATSSEIIATAIAQKDKPQIDVVLCDYAAWLQGRHQDIFDEVDTASVPNLNGLYDYAPIRVGDAILGSYTYTDTLGIIYQPDMFKKNGWAEPTGWDDLLRPEFKGKISIPPVSNTYGLYTLIHFARANGGGENNIDPGFETLAKIAPGVVDWTTTFAKLGGYLQSELVAISVFGANSGFEIQKRGIPAGVVIPDPDYLSPTAVGVMKDAPNPEGARALMNFILGAEFQSFRAERFGSNAMNKSITVSDEAKKYLLTPEQMARLTTVDYEVVTQNRAEWNERFEKEIAPIR